MTTTCANCGRSDQRITRGRCQACYQYLRKKGVERPRRLIEYYKLRSITRCRCGRPVRALGLCSGCYHYAKRNNGRSRPRHLREYPDRCLNPACRRPLAGQLVRKGRCPNCYQYRWRTGEDRPAELTGGNRWCECGQPAQHRVEIKVGSFGKRERMSTKREALDLCEECYGYEMEAAA